MVADFVETCPSGVIASMAPRQACCIAIKLVYFLGIFTFIRSCRGRNEVIRRIIIKRSRSLCSFRKVIGGTWEDTRVPIGA